MIKAENLTKRFGKKEVLSSLNCVIEEGSIYGLVGANGAGKSTFLRLLSGVYYPDTGFVEINGQKVFDNSEVKMSICSVGDELYFPAGATVGKIGGMYQALYTSFDFNYYKEKCEMLKLPQNSKLSTFSKGMKRQVSMLAALSCKCAYMLFDETFDGLDPVVRNLMKKLIYDAVAERNATVVLTSHNLRELEDICDHLGILYKGGILFQGDINNIKTSVCKVQMGFRDPPEKYEFDGVDIMNITRVGSVATLIVRGDREDVYEKLMKYNPLILDVLPLTLEEVFIYEMEVLGYAFNELNI